MDANHLLKALSISDTNSLGFFDLFFAMTVPFCLCLIIGLFYKATSRNNSYTMSFIYSLPLFGFLSSIITLLIGSNIARAFGLVGALSLIRFRTALKEPLESIYLFWCLAVGMACGTGFYLAAILIVVLGVIYMKVIYTLKVGVSDKVHIIVRSTFSSEATEKVIGTFEKHLKKEFSTVVGLNSHYGDDTDQESYSYSCKLKKKRSSKEIQRRLSSLEGVSRVEIVSQDTALFV